MCWPCPSARPQRSWRPSRCPTRRTWPPCVMPSVCAARTRMSQCAARTSGPTTAPVLLAVDPSQSPPMSRGSLSGYVHFLISPLDEMAAKLQAITPSAILSVSFNMDNKFHQILWHFQALNMSKLHLESNFWKKMITPRVILCSNLPCNYSVPILLFTWKARLMGQYWIHMGPLKRWVACLVLKLPSWAFTSIMPCT